MAINNKTDAHLRDHLDQKSKKGWVVGGLVAWDGVDSAAGDTSGGTSDPRVRRLSGLSTLSPLPDIT